jgi:hypothetical protein
MLRRLSNAAIVLGSMALCCLPLLRFSPAPWSDPAENRVSAPWPGRPATLAALRKFPAAFEDFFNDHFGLRSALIDLRNRIDLGLFDRSPTDKVLIGRDGWLFYTGEDSLDDFRGRRPFTEAELDGWYRSLKQRRDWLAAQGIAYRFVVAPNKQSIYPERMPASVRRGASDHLDQLLAYLSQRGEADLVQDLRPTLLAHKADGLLYPAVDVHWNPLGAFLAYRALGENLGVRLPLLDRFPQDFKPGEIQDGDLGAMIHRRPSPVPTVSDVGPPLPCAAHEIAADPLLKWTEATRVKPDTVSDCARADTDVRAVVFHDSMILALRDYLASSVAHARFAWMNPSFDDLKLFVRQEHPTLVIEERVERTLIDLPRATVPVPATLTTAPPPPDRGGWVDVGQTEPGTLIVNGWGQWQSQQPGRRLLVDTNLPVRDLTVTESIRPDVAEALKDDRLARSGFQLHLRLDEARPMPSVIRLCLWTEDPVFGRRRLNYNDHREWDSCPAPGQSQMIGAP